MRAMAQTTDDRPRDAAITSPPLAELEDEALVPRAVHGDVPAFEELVRRYQDRIFNFALRYTGNPADAEEVAQEAFMKAYRALDRFRGDAKFSTWLFQITKNLCINRYHRKRRRMAHRRISIQQRMDDEDAAPLQIESEEPGPQEEALRGELRERIEAGITELEPHYRAALVLRDIEGLDYAEIGQILDVPVGTVKSRIHRARNELQQILRPFLEDGV